MHEASDKKWLAAGIDVWRIDMYCSIEHWPEPFEFARFHKTAAVLERFVSSAPEPVDLERIAGRLEVSEPETRKICLQLQRAGLICRIDERDEWALAVDRKGITLEDVWRALSEGSDLDHRDTECHSPEVELLVSQALMAMQQHISRLLREFQLDRVSVSRSSRSTIPNHFLLKSRSVWE